MAWRDAHRSLVERATAVPAMLRAAADAAVPPPRVGLREVRRVVATGIGASAAHARLAAFLLAEHCGIDARFRPLSEFLGPPPVDSCDDLLVVVSQGLAPNARLALADVAAWRHVTLLTATQPETARAAGRDDAARFVEHLCAIGVEVRTFAAGAEEYGTLLRVTGPMAGLLASIRWVEALADQAGLWSMRPRRDGTMLAAEVDAAIRRGDDGRALAASGRLVGPLALVATGAYAGLVEHLAAKLLEGVFVPMPPVFDVLALAHGPFQQAWTQATTFLALTRPDAAGEGDLLARFEGMLDADRHRLVRLPATAPLPWCLFEHEAIVNEIVLAGIAAHGVDQARWPGRGRDRPLYAVGADETTATVPGEPDAVASAAERASQGGSHAVPARAVGATIERGALAALAWPELAGMLAAGPLTALVPLGATEQHGPHLPFATDTWIGDALAARLAARFPGETIACPTLPLGCSSEHGAFPGTLDLAPATLAAVLTDVLRSLARHGFTAAFLFSAHGGNAAVLAAMLPDLRAAAAPLHVDAVTDLAAIAATLARAARAAGIAPAAAGHHAGESETSIMLALRPETVRAAAFAPGLVAEVPDAQALFYPSLRDHAPDGTVGDPRGASATRADAYLDEWVELLAESYLRAKNANQAKGTQKA